MMNKHIKQYLEYTYPIGEDGYIHSDKISSIADISNELIEFYCITEKEAKGYILEYYNNVIRVKDSDGYWRERTYDNMGNELTYKDSRGYWIERTYTSMGNQLTYKDHTDY